MVPMVGNNGQRQVPSFEIATNKYLLLKLFSENFIHVYDAFWLLSLLYLSNPSQPPSFLQIPCPNSCLFVLFCDPLTSMRSINESMGLLALSIETRWDYQQIQQKTVPLSLASVNRQ